jgi:hypothetical protein
VDADLDPEGLQEGGYAHTFVKNVIPRLQQELEDSGLAHQMAIELVSGENEA